MKIVVNVDEILESKNKTRYWLSRETGITYAAIAKFCDQKTASVSYEMLEKVCTALDIKVGDVLVMKTDFELAFFDD